MRRTVLVTLALSTGLAGLALASPAAEAANPVAPGQAFVGRVTGSFSDATVKVVCPGPAGRRGHPVSGQDLEVLSPPPPVAHGIRVSVGRTGTAGRAIVARFTDDPSVAITFRQYFANLPIPTSLMLPCSGRGKVVFRPTPTSPSAVSSVVSVTYANIAESRVEGTALYSPTCPVEQVPPDPACAPRPGPAHIRLLRGDTVAAQGDAGPDGHFAISVAPGTYIVAAESRSAGIGRGCSANPEQVTASPGAATTVAVSCDTGIR